ncbi:MAG: MMPL family transporter [Verrucomicrobia bacterium]|nr:MMPL family transporter [Verrucomicrobiota bacterium]
MSSQSESLVVRCLHRLADAVYEHPRWFLWPQILLFATCGVFTVRKLEFNTSRNDLVGANKKYHQNFLQFKKEFPGQDDLVVIVESENSDKNRQFVERLGKRLETETNLFTEIFYRNDLKMLGSKALLFLDDEDLGGLRDTLKEYRPFIQNFARATNLVSFFQMVNDRFRTASREQNADNDSLVKALPALERIVREAADCLGRPGTPPSPGLGALFGQGQEAEQKIYITFAGGRIYLVSAHALREDLNAPALERLRELAREIQVEVPGVNIGITGEPVLEYDEMLQSQRDTTVATIVSLTLCALIFIYGYHETGRPLKATLCLVIGLGYTMGFTTLVVGHLNILTITFAPMLIGMAIDFGVHLVTRYEEELRHGRTEREALEKAMVFTGQGIFTGCLTTAGAFFAMSITNFKGIQEMGIISGGGMVICLVPMMTMLPVLLLRGRQNVLDHQLAPEVDHRARIERFWLERPALVVGVTLTLCALSFVKFPKVAFDYNLLNMQSRGLPAVVFEKKLIESGSNSVLFAAIIADSLPQAVALETRITNLATVASVKSMVQFLAGEPAAKLATIGEIKSEAAAIQFAEPDAEPVSVPELDRVFFSLKGYLGLALAEVHKEGDVKLEEQLLSLRKALVDLRQKLAAADEPRVAAKLAAFQRALFDDIRETFATLKNQDNRSGLTAADLPPALRNRFIGQSGKLLLQVFPKEDVWQRDRQEKFVKELRSVDPNVTGTPVQLLEYTTLLKDSYVEAAWYALGAIVVLVFIHFRSLSSVMLALLPVAIGAIWMVGFMGWSGILFNPANIMTLPLVIGIGVTNGIHILNRFAEERNPGILAKSTGKAVLVSGLTTIAGFGSLILAKHQGIESLGYVMAVGTATCMAAGLTFLPALIKLLMPAGQDQKKKPSGDNAQSTLGREELR